MVCLAPAERSFGRSPHGPAGAWVGEACWQGPTHFHALGRPGLGHGGAGGPRRRPTCVGTCTPIAYATPTLQSAISEIRSPGRAPAVATHGWPILSGTGHAGCLVDARGDGWFAGEAAAPGAREGPRGSAAGSWMRKPCDRPSAPGSAQLETGAHVGHDVGSRPRDRKRIAKPASQTRPIREPGAARIWTAGLPSGGRCGDPSRSERDWKTRWRHSGKSGS